MGSPSGPRSRGEGPWTEACSPSRSRSRERSLEVPPGGVPPQTGYDDTGVQPGPGPSWPTLRRSRPKTTKWLRTKRRPAEPIAIRPKAPPAAPGHDEPRRQQGAPPTPPPLRAFGDILSPRRPPAGDDIPRRDDDNGVHSPPC